MAVLSVGLLIGCGTKNIPEVTVQIQQGADPVEQVNAVQAKLAELFLNYRSAQLGTNALLLVDPTSTPLSWFQELAQKVIVQWALVEKNTQELGTLLPPETSFLVPRVYAVDEPQLIINDDTKFNDKAPLFELNDKALADIANSAKNLDAMYVPKDISNDGEVKLVPTTRENIDAIKAKVPSAKILTLVQNAFGVTAKEAKNLIEEHYQAETVNYNNSDAFYAKAATTAQAISTVSKVALFIGGAVITAWGSAVAWGALGTTTLGTAFGSSLSAWQGTTIAIGGVSTVCAIGEDGVALGFADAETSASFKVMGEKLWPINTVLNLMDLKDGLWNPNNLVTVYEWGKYGLDKASGFLNMNVQGDQIKINAKPTTYPELTPDGLTKQLPMGYGYRLIVTANGEQIYTNEWNIPAPVEQKASSMGSYAGKITMSYNFNGSINPIEMDAHLVITSAGEATLTFDDKWSIGYGVEGMQMTANYTVKGQAKGTIDKEGVISLNGNFSSTVEVQLPPEVSNAMPPEYKARLNNGSAGTVSATLKWEDNLINGTVSMSANGITQQGMFETVE